MYRKPFVPIAIQLYWPNVQHVDPVVALIQCGQTHNTDTYIQTIHSFKFQFQGTNSISSFQKFSQLILPVVRACQCGQTHDTPDQALQRHPEPTRK